MKKKIFLIVVSSLLSTCGQSKNMYRGVNKLEIETIECRLLQEKLKTLYWAHQSKLIDELKAFNKSSEKALKYLKKNISSHLAKHKKSLKQFAKEIEEEAGMIETCLHELDVLYKKTTNKHTLTSLDHIKQNGLILKHNLLELTTISLAINYHDA